jgi:hypothetical protein
MTFENEQEEERRRASLPLPLGPLQPTRMVIDDTAVAGPALSIPPSFAPYPSTPSSDGRVPALSRTQDCSCSAFDSVRSTLQKRKRRKLQHPPHHTHFQLCKAATLGAFVGGLLVACVLSALHLTHPQALQHFMDGLEWVLEGTELPSCHRCSRDQIRRADSYRQRKGGGILSYLNLYPSFQTNNTTSPSRNNYQSSQHSRRNLALGSYSSSSSPSTSKSFLGNNDDEGSYKDTQLVIAGKMTVDDAPCNIAQFNLKTNKWSLTERIQLSLYNSYSGGEVYSLLSNHTNTKISSGSSSSSSSSSSSGSTYKADDDENEFKRYVPHGTTLELETRPIYQISGLTCHSQTILPF